MGARDSTFIPTYGMRGYSVSAAGSAFSISKEPCTPGSRSILPASSAACSKRRFRRSCLGVPGVRVDERAVSLQSRSLQAFHLGAVVPATHAQSLAEIALALECRVLCGRHRPTLQLQRAHRGRTQTAVIIRFSGTKIALRRHMQANGVRHLGTESARQPRGADLLVFGILGPFTEIIRSVVDQMTNVVQ